jgi:hypothetical protein
MGQAVTWPTARAPARTDRPRRRVRPCGPPPAPEPSPPPIQKPKKVSQEIGLFWFPVTRPSGGVERSERTLVARPREGREPGQRPEKGWP